MPRLDESFDRAVEILFACAGRVVAPAWARAASSRRRSRRPSPPPARPSLFLHPAEAIHGDLGRIVKGDVVLAVSYSGDTEEILALVRG